MKVQRATSLKEALYLRYPPARQHLSYLGKLGARPLLHIQYILIYENHFKDRKTKGLFILLRVYTFITVLMGRMLSFYQHKHFKSRPGPLILLPKFDKTDKAVQRTGRLLVWNIKRRVVKIRLH